MEPGPGPYELEFVDVAPGVILAYRPEPLRAPVAGNVTILINDRDVVLVDGGAAPKAASQILAEVHRRTALPISTVVLTHGHEDHVLGTHVFEEAFPGLRVISRKGTSDYLAPGGPVARRVSTMRGRVDQLRADGEAEIERLRRAGGHPDLIEHLERRWGPDLSATAAQRALVRLRQPDEVFSTRLEITRGERVIQLLDLGPGKSGSGTVVYLPGERIVVAGDVVVSPIPYGFARDPEGWRRTMAAVAELEADVLIPGHGAPLVGTDYVARVIALADFILNGVAAGIAEGLGPEDLMKRLDFEPWISEFCAGDPIREYHFREWMLEPGVSRAFTAQSRARARGPGPTRQFIDGS